MNTDNSIVIVKKLLVNDVELIPLNNNVLAKNKTYNFILQIVELTDKDCIKLYVEDVLRTAYCFTIIPFIYENKKGEKQYNILRIEECKVENTDE